MELIQQLQAWHWFVLAVLLVVVEMLTPTGFMLGLALAALALAGIVFVVPDLAWAWQLSLFGVLGVLSTLAQRRWFQRISLGTGNPLLNDRAAQQIGRSFVLSAELDRTGAEMLGDTRWQLRCDGRIASGARVRVIGVEGMALVVEEEP